MTNSLSLISKVQSQLLWAGALLCGLSLGVAASAEPPSAAQATDSPAANQAAPAVPFDLDIPPPVVSGSNDRSESLAGGWSGAGDLFEGFTEPYRSVEVAAPESGTIEEIVVRQGQLVKQGDILAVLDRDILQSSLDIARAKSESTAKREAAKIESLLKQRRLDNFYRLGKDNSSNEEIERARADVDLAQTQVLAAEEELKLNSLELKRIQVQLDRRTIRSPIAGVVTRLHREVGEFVPQTDPKVATIVDLNRLRIVFHPPARLGESLDPQQPVQVRLLRTATIVPAEIEYVAPVTNADSGSVRLEVILDNASGRYRSGVRCALVHDERLGRNEPASPLRK